MRTDHIKPDNIAAPIDIRLVPAAGLTAAVCWASPLLPGWWSQHLPFFLVSIGLITVILIVCFRRNQHTVHSLLIVSIACWLATPAAVLTHQQQLAAAESGWTDFVTAQDSANMSVRIVTDPVEREGPFGPQWFVTADVESFGRELTPTPHPAKIVISADKSWSELSSDEPVCFLGRITDSADTVFVQALTDAQPGTCEAGPSEPSTTGRDTLRTAVRVQAAETLGFAPQLLPGLILGDRSQQSQDIDDAMKVSGLSHLSAVSGAHTSLIASAATLLFRSLRLPRPIVIAAFLGTLVLFVQIVGTQPSILRAATMGAIGAWAVFFGRGSQALPLLALSTIILLTVTPQIIHEVGFQLSVAATAGIVLGAQPLERWMRPAFEKFLPDFWASLMSSSLAISIAAQLACQPLLLTFIDYISVYSVVANLFATPLLPLITVPGTIAASLSLAAPALSQLLFHLVALPTAAIGWIATTTTDLPGSTLPWPEGLAGSLLIGLHWAATGIVLVKLLRRQRQLSPPVRLESALPRWRQFTHRLSRETTVWNTLQYTVVVIAVFAHLAAFWPTRVGGIVPEWDVIGCDVGQGDMFLVRTGPTSAMVVDTGEDPELAKQCLQAADVDRIDVLVLTHLHADHVGGLQGVLNIAEPEQIIYSTGTDPTYTPESTGLPPRAQQVTEPVIQVIDHAAHDDEHPVQLRWSVLSANADASNENNASVVLLIEIYRPAGVTTALFTGDLEEDAAATLLAEQHIPTEIDILKLSHHGARNGGTDLIEHTRPEVALIGVGADNSYGHPHDDILEALDPNTDLRRTDLHGTFSVTLEHSPTYAAAQR